MRGKQREKKKRKNEGRWVRSETKENEGNMATFGPYGVYGYPSTVKLSWT